jgi:hypothetical protein
VDHFICLLKEIHVLVKGQETLFDERSYYGHLNGLEKLLRKQEIALWGSEIKELLVKNITPFGQSNKADKSSS